MTTRLAELSVAEVRAVLAGREATAVEITEACLEALAARNPRVRAFLAVTADDALAAARTADAALARGDARPLTGVPTGVNPAFGTPANPWAAGRVPGGSSSGSGAAVAARLVPAALGTDTGGSIRIPASLCGATGLKPTYGRVSRAGVTPLAWTLDHVGPLARSAEDAALLLGVLAGHDAADPTSARVPVPDYVARLDRSL